MNGKLAVTCWELSWPEIHNFYLEATVETTEQCPGDAAYGLLFRAPDTNSGYLYGLTCDGRYTMASWDGESDIGASLLPYTAYGGIETGPGKINRIGVAVIGDLHIYYINGKEIVRFEDDTFTEDGRFGFYVHGGIIDTEPLPVFALFDDLAYWQLDPPE